MAISLIILTALLFIAGILVMGEVALTSARKVKLKMLADGGNPRAKATLEIARKPARFVSTVKFGVLLIATSAGVFGGMVFTDPVASWLSAMSLTEPYVRGLAAVLITLSLAGALLVFAELLPRRLALTSSERVAVGLGPPLEFLARISSPVVGLLTFLSEAVLRLFGIKNPASEAPVTEEEVNTLLEQGISAGVFNKTEKEMVEGVMELDQLPVTALMTPRPKIVFLNIDDNEEINWRKIVSSGHSYFPVYQGNRDQVLGMVAVKALWAHSAIGLTTNLKNLLVPPLVVPETMMAIQLLESFKKSGKHIALVTDEFGAIQGLLTLIDVLEAIVGDIPSMGRRNAPAAKQREDGSWLIDATLGTTALKEMLGLSQLPQEDKADFQTLGGFVVTHFGRIPAAGDWFDFGGWRFEVVDMDRHRVDKVLVSKAVAASVERAAS